MILAIDVAYSGTSAQVAGGIFDAWEATDLFKQYRISLDHIMDYESGQFYKRELPCIQALLAQITEHIDMIIIDGYVHLGNEQKAGLGQYLYEALMLKVPVIGVAKISLQAHQKIAKFCEDKASNRFIFLRSVLSLSLPSNM